MCDDKRLRFLRLARVPTTRIDRWFFLKALYGACNVGDNVADRKPDLLGRVAVADGDGAIFKCVKVNCDT